MDNNNYKFGGHETFYFRKGWLYKGLKNIELNNAVFTDKNINTSDTFGLGVSMVKSLRFWLQAVGLTKEVKKDRVLIQNLTEMGEVVNLYDRYMEESGTLCLLHYKLATNVDFASSWYYFFNEFSMREFSKEDYIDSINTHVKFKQINTSSTTLEGDLTCLLNTYIPREFTDPEDNMECPLSELGLIEIKDKKIYKKSAPREGFIPLHILLAMIVEQHPGEKEIKIIDLLKEKNSIGKLFNLDFISLSTYLDKMQMANLIQVVRTAGLDVIKIKENKTFKQCIIDYYESIKA